MYIIIWYYVTSYYKKIQVILLIFYGSIYIQGGKETPYFIFSLKFVSFFKYFIKFSSRYCSWISGNLTLKVSSKYYTIYIRSGLRQSGFRFIKTGKIRPFVSRAGYIVVHKMPHFVLRLQFLVWNTFLKCYCDLVTEWGKYTL